ncbi:hypothetical protein NDU88_001111 [Pleurodeles waltl]|uniref:Uncharacterized protein n=1 Tax=Pleurodeles waltl TaxID=8319 RepID=A0AAV7TI91_PLEWA|nr:hypothetical protein NDU88_001111 [Pleurodeles waltl]
MNRKPSLQKTLKIAPLTQSFRDTLRRRRQEKERFRKNALRNAGNGFEQRSHQPALTIERSWRREKSERETLRAAVLFAYGRGTAKDSLHAARRRANKFPR